MSIFKLAACQHLIRNTKAGNLAAMESEVAAAAAAGAAIAVLPEIFVCDFTYSAVSANEEEFGGEITERLSAAARSNGIWLVGGSFPEKDGSRRFNTCTAFAPDGSLAAKYRKTHLFDVSIDPGTGGGTGLSASESRMFTPGDELVTFDTGFARIGLAICYDVRFPYLFTELARRGAEVVIMPAAFSARTGAAHWELMLRARAVDAQVYVAGCDSATDEQSRFRSYAHSRIIEPWGEVIAAAGSGEEMIVADIDTALVASSRRQLPVLEHSREAELCRIS